MVGNLELTRADFLAFKSYLWRRGISWKTFKNLERGSKLDFVEGWWVKEESKVRSKIDMVDHGRLLNQLLGLIKNSK